ncbi:MAG: hypothetical protein WAN14_20425 [Candidatus Acidiferrales bacterium]
MAQPHAATILADQIKKWMRPYVVPAEILDNLTTAEVLELRAMSRAMKKENPQAYAGVRDTAINFLRTHKGREARK